MKLVNSHFPVVLIQREVLVRIREREMVSEDGKCW